MSVQSRYRALYYFQLLYTCQEVAAVSQFSARRVINRKFAEANLNALPGQKQLNQ